MFRRMLESLNKCCGGNQEDAGEGEPPAQNELGDVVPRNTEMDVMNPPAAKRRREDEGDNSSNSSSIDVRNWHKEVAKKHDCAIPWCGPYVEGALSMPKKPILVSTYSDEIEMVNMQYSSATLSMAGSVNNAVKVVENLNLEK